MHNAVGDVNAGDAVKQTNLVGSRAGMLALLVIACGWLATRAFRSYQRSV